VVAPEPERASRNQHHPLPYYKSILAQRVDLGVVSGPDYKARGHGQALFDNLQSAQVTDWMNAILGLKNLGGKELAPTLLSALNDPETQVRQVANFALEGLTGHTVAVNPLPEEWSRVASAWHTWWRD
jgi:hypothetical protein